MVGEQGEHLFTMVGEQGKHLFTMMGEQGGHLLTMLGEQGRLVASHFTLQVRTTNYTGRTR